MTTRNPGNTPSDLASRVQAARQQAAAYTAKLAAKRKTTTTQTARGTPPEKTAPKIRAPQLTPNQPTNRQKQPTITEQRTQTTEETAHLHTPTTTQPSAQNENQGGSNRKIGRPPGAKRIRKITPVSLNEAEADALIDLAVGISRRPEAVRQLRGPLLGALAAMLAGAQLPGTHGNADRGALFRLTGLPLGAGMGAGGQGGSAREDQRRSVGHFGDMLARRLAGAELGKSPTDRRDPVTIDQQDDGECPEDGHDNGYTQEMDDLVRMPDDQPEAPIEAAGAWIADDGEEAAKRAAEEMERKEKAAAREGGEDAHPDPKRRGRPSRLSLAWR